MRGARSVGVALVSAAVAASCSPASPVDPPALRLDRARSAVLGGRPSGDDENANVVIETSGDFGTPLRCSGRLVTPRLVLTARHCLLKAKTQNAECNPDGSPRDPGADQTLETTARMTVKVGSDRSALQSFVVQDALSVLEVTACRSDIAFLVLRDEALAVRTPFRRAPVLIATELTISGWGLTGDAETELPMKRSTLAGVRILDVGPGFIPAGTFIVGGNSLCYGDSGAVALVGGSVAGVYSRIIGTTCAAQDSQNLFNGVATESALITRAFAAIGEMPWYEGSPPPWLAAEGAACKQGDECRSSVCEEARCKAACGAPGLACPNGQVCEAATRCVAVATPPPPPAPEEPDSGGCSFAPTSRAPARGLWLGLALAVATLLSRRTYPRYRG